MGPWIRGQTPPASLLLLAGLVTSLHGSPAPAEGPPLPGGEPAPPPIIEAIRFEGNRHTRASTMLREMLVRPGDPADPELIERSRQAIMDLRLFKSVDARLETGSVGSILIVAVREKRYFFALPALSRTGDGDLTYGAQAKFDNLGGRNHGLEIEAVRKDFASGARADEEDRLQVASRHPRVGDGPWRLDTSLRYGTALLEEERDGVRGDYRRIARGIGLSATRWKRPAGPSQGWHFGTGLSVEEFDFRLEGGEPGLFFDTTEVGLSGQVGFTRVHSYDFNRSGHDARYLLGVFPEALGSAGDRLIHALTYRLYQPVTRRPFTNLNFQFRWGLATESLFGDPTFSVAGSTRLRGYDRRAVEGEAFVLANLEFLTPVFGERSLRAVVFLDAGDAFRDPGHFTLSELKAAGGIGLRWRVRAFVDVDLRLDVAHGFDADAGGETRVYAGTDATF